jgi:hypothetical protein
METSLVKKSRIPQTDLVLADPLCDANNVAHFPPLFPAGIETDDDPRCIDGLLRGATGWVRFDLSGLAD